MNICIVIIGIKERQPLIDRICKQVKVNYILLDENKRGPLNSVITFLKSLNWENFTHTIFLQDDAYLCNNFLNISNSIIKTHPDKVVGLFPWDFLDSFIVPINNGIPYYDVGTLSGVGIIFPNIYANDYLDFAVSSPYPNQDDLTLQLFCEQKGIDMIQTVPAVVQHCDNGSYWNCDKGFNERRVKYFELNPIANWESTKVNYLKYHSHREKLIAEKIEWSKQYIKNLVKERSQNNDK